MAKTKKNRNFALAIAYLRVSTDRQDLGLDAQRSHILQWAQTRQIAICGWYSDQVSGGADLADRPALVQALASLADGDAGVFVVAKRDRLAREATNAGIISRRVQDMGAMVMSADGIGDGDEPASKLLAGICDVVAEFERSLIRSRTCAALAVKKARGERWNSTPPYGQKLENLHFVPCEAEQKVIAKCQKLRQKGLSYRKMAEILTKSGHFPRMGKNWHPQTLRNILERIERSAVNWSLRPPALHAPGVTAA